MPNSQKDLQSSSLDNYVFIDQKSHVITKKQSNTSFFFTELTVYLLISLASYFSIYLGTNKFTNQKELEDNIDLLTKYFSMSNIENSLLGILIVIGLISSLNYIATNSKISLQNFLHRLTHSFIDFIFLMLSSMLGLFFAVLEFTSILELTSSIADLRHTMKFGICLLLFTLVLYIIILTSMNNNKNHE